RSTLHRAGHRRASPIGAGRNLALSGLGDLAAADAARARSDTRHTAIHHGSHRLQVRPLELTGLAVRVANVVGGLSTLAADVALVCHDRLPRGEPCVASLVPYGKRAGVLEELVFATLFEHHP